MKGWKTVQIGCVADIFDGPHATPNIVDSGAIFLGIDALDQGRINLKKTRCVTPEDYKKWTRRVTPQQGDVVFSYETRLGEAALIPEGLKCCLGRRMGLIRAKQPVLDPKFFLYYYLSPTFQEVIRLKTILGATVNRISIKEFPTFPVLLPPLEEQQSIAHILGTLDDKIELNRRQNATLEAMAQAIFKDWFVDFGPVHAKMEGRQPEGISREIADLFPDRLDDEGKPEGWERKKLGDLITFYSERIKSDKLTESNYVSTENMLSDKKGITKASSLPTTDSVPAFCTGHILVSNIRPYFKKIWFATFDGGRSNDVLDFCPLIVGTNYFIFNILICDAFFDFMMQTAKGSKMPRGDKNAIMAYSVVAPTEVLQRAYSSLVEVYYKKINSNVLKNEVLTSLRDTLLPKLISGELRVPDAEKMVADIV